MLRQIDSSSCAKIHKSLHITKRNPTFCALRAVFVPCMMPYLSNINAPFAGFFLRKRFAMSIEAESYRSEGRLYRSGKTSENILRKVAPFCFD